MRGWFGRVGSPAALGLLICALAASCKKDEKSSPAPTPAPAPASASAPVREQKLNLLVSNEDSGDVSIIDIATGEVTTTVPVGKRPRGIKLSPDRKNVFVALSGSAKAGPGVDESKLPPADRSADGVGMLDATTGQLVKVLKTG